MAGSRYCSCNTIERGLDVGIEIPPVVWIGTGLLAFTAGVVNAVGYLGYEQHAFSHMTGTISLASMGAGQARWNVVQQLLSIVLGFVAGSYLAGLLLRERDLSYVYVWLLAAEAVCLLASGFLLASGNALGACLAAAGCGVQNAMTSFYSGSAIRTTHLTGFFTDLGLVLGQATRGGSWPRRRVSMWLLVLVAFGGGGVVATVLFDDMGFFTLALPAAIAGACAAGLALHLSRSRRR